MNAGGWQIMLAFRRARGSTAFSTITVVFRWVAFVGIELFIALLTL